MTALAHDGAAGGGRAGSGTGVAMDSHDRIVPSVREGSGLRLVSPELVGRDAELSTIAQLIGSVAAGSGATLLLSGEAGMGKSALLGRAIEMGRRAGLRVLRGECVRFEMGRAFGPFVDALRPLRGEPHVTVDLAVAPASETARAMAGAPVDRYRTHAAFLRAFAAAAEERALLISVDDLHWADESTLELFAHLSRRLTRSVLLVGTYRPEEVRGRPALRRALGDLARDRSWDLPLRRLTASEVGRALRLILGSSARLSGETREVLQARSAGNPLFLEEMLRSLAQRGDLHQVESGWRLGPIRDLPLPASVQEAVRERFATFDPVAREVVLVAATVGERFDLELVGRASAAPYAAVIRAIHEAISGQLVVEAEGDRDDRFAFRHPVIRDAVLEEVLRLERRGLHRRVAEALEQDGDRDDALSALAYHWEEAGDRDRAFTYHRRAGEHEAGRFAHAEALAHFERALHLAPVDDQTVAELSMRAAAMARVLGRAGRVLDRAGIAARICERLGDAQGLGVALLTMHDAAGLMLWPRSRRGELIARAFAALTPLGDTPELARAYSVYAMHAAKFGYRPGAPHAPRSAGELAQALAAAERAVAIAERHPGARATAHWRLGLIHMLRGDPESAIASLRRGVASLDEEGAIRAPQEISNINMLADLVERAAGDTEEARSLRQRAHELRDRYGVMQTYMAKMHTLLLTADWDEFVRIHDDHSDDRDEAAYVLTHQSLHRAFIDVARTGPSALPAARAAYEEALRSEDVTESDAVAAPEVALVAGDHPWVLEATERAADLVSHPDPLGPFGAFAGIYALLAARDARDEAAASRWLDRFPTEVPRAAASFNLTAVEHTIRYGALERSWTDGDRDHAIDALATLIDERKARGQDFGRTTLPGLGVWPLLTYFLALREIEMRMERRGPDDPAAAEARLEWVVDFYRTGRATWYLERLRERAAVWGIRFPEVGAQQLSAIPLTGREREVALLVAKGMTNREIAEHLTLSVRTAESHVERIRGKLGFRTRAQIAAWVTEHEMARVG